MNVRYIDADESMKERIAIEWGEKIARHMHLDDGFSILAMQDDTVAGLISVCWKPLPHPLPETYEGYIDIIEIHRDFRRRGIAKQLVGLSLDRAREKKAYQLRAWSSLDKIEAIPMWKALGFGLCPATTFPHGKEVRGYFVVRQLDCDFDVA